MVGKNFCKNFRNFLISILIILGSSACKKGTPIGNTPPETYLFLDKIQLTGDNRLKTNVHLYWYGDDKDGKVAGFEFSINNGPWTFTTAYDSMFVFTVPPVADTTDILFKIRAIDDKNDKDPTPAELIIPIKNSPPVAKFTDEVANMQDTLPIIITLQVSVNDPDGNQTLDSLYFKVNNGNWINLPVSTNLITVVPDNPNSVGKSTAKVYLNINDTPEPFTIADFNVGGDNVFYVKAKDNGNVFSDVDTSKTFFITEKKGEWLLIDHWKVANPVRPIELFDSIFKQLNINYDYLDFNINVPQYFNPTLKLLFNVHSKVFWFAQGESYRLDVLLRAESIIQNHLKNNGKLLVMFPMYSGVTPDNAIFDFIPADSISSVETDGRIPTNAIITSQDPNYPDLKNSFVGFITGVNPIYVKPGAVAIYSAPVQPKTGGTWNYSKIVGAKGLLNGNVNVIYFDMGLHQMQGNNNLDSLFNQIENEFNW